MISKTPCLRSTILQHSVVDRRVVDRIEGDQSMRMFKVTACVPSETRIRTQRELQNTYFTKLVPYDNWFREQQRIMKMGGKIIKVQLFTGKPGTNTGLL
jgi:phycobilisome core linker protein